MDHVMCEFYQVQQILFSVFVLCIILRVCVRLLVIVTFIHDIIHCAHTRTHRHIILDHISLTL